MARVLGQLGGHAANDQGEAPRSGGSHRVPLGRRSQFTSLGSACRAATTLDGVDGFEVPSWSAVTAGQRPPIMEVEDREPGVPRQGWQHAAAIRIESSFRTEILMPRMSPVEQALLRSQSGPCAGVAFSVCPSSPLTRIDSALFRVLLQRRLHLPLPLSQRICGCGRPLDPFGHHRAACSRTGALGRRGFALESAAARVCREAGGRVVTNMFVRDMDLGVPVAGDNRRLEVVVDGLPLHGGVQLAVDTTLVSSVRGNKEPRQGAATTDGVALTQARRRKEKTHRELTGPGARARLVVLALEVGGRWSAEAKSFVGQLAKARARSEPRVLQRRMEQAWRLRWCSILSCAAARSFAMSLLGLKGTIGADGHAPMPHEVECDHRFAGLD